jgi:nitrogen fixation protein NifX
MTYEEEDDEGGQPFSDEVALRIGLAAQCLKEVSLGELLEALTRILGDKIDVAALNKVTVTQLKASFGRAADIDGDEEFERDTRAEDMKGYKDAVRILWGESTSPEPPVTPVVARAFGQTTQGPRLRVAVASNSAEELDGHFGSCSCFLIFDVSATEIALVDARDTALAEQAEDRNGYRVQLISDCKILYVVHAGGPAAAKVIKADIHLISAPEGGNARAILSQLQKVISGSPPPWLVKALKQTEQTAHL